MRRRKSEPSLAARRQEPAGGRRARTLSPQGRKQAPCRFGELHRQLERGRFRDELLRLRELRRLEVEERFYDLLFSGGASVQALAGLVRERGGGGSMLLFSEYADISESCFEDLSEYLSEGELLEFLRLIVSEYPDLLSMQDDCNETVLHRAVDCKAPTTVIRFLIDNGRSALSMASHDGGRLPIHVACNRELPLPQLQTLVLADPSTLEVRDGDGYVALHSAVDCKAPAAVIRYLIANGPAALSMADLRGRLPVHVACDRQLPLAQLQSLVEADPTTLEVRDNDGCVALHRAVQDEAPMAVIRYLVENGRGALTMADHRGRLPIHVACDRQLPLAQLQSLVEADPTTLEVRDNDGCVALHRAIESTDFGDPLELRTVQMLIDAHPSSLEVSDRFGSTPIMRAILAASEEEEVVPEAFDALYRMIDVGGANSLQARWTRYDGSTDWDSALHLSVRLLPNLGLVSSLLWADRQVLGVRDSDGRLPLHVACAAPAGDEALDVIALLIEASPASAFEARDNFGMTPIMIFNSIESRYFRRNVEVLHFLHLLVEMVRRSPLSVRGTFSFDPPFSFDPDARSNGTTVLEVACTRIPRAEKLVLLVMEAWPAALCVSLAFDLRDLGLPQELETAMTREARLMLLALVEVLLHETTREIAVDAIQGGIHSDAPRGVVLDTIRNHILRAVGQRVDDDVGRLVLGGSIGLVQEIQKNVRGDSFGALRSDVLYHHDLQQLLEEHEPLLEMVTGVYHMNRAGRLGPEGNVVNESEVIPDSTAFSAQQHVRVLESVKDNLSCLFLHVRGCPALFARVRKANPERMHSDEGAGIQQEYDQDLEDRIDISTNERLISMVRQIAAVQAQLAAAQTTLLEAMWQDDPVEKRKLAADGEAQFVDACLAFRAAQHSAAVVELPANAGDASA